MFQLATLQRVNRLIDNAKNFYEGREKTIKGFKEKNFLIKCDDETEQQQTSKKPAKDDTIAFSEQIIKKETDINMESFKKYFNFQRSCSMLKDLYQINDKEKNNKLVSAINSRLKDLK